MQKSWTNYTNIYLVYYLGTKQAVRTQSLTLYVYQVGSVLMDTVLRVTTIITIKSAPSYPVMHSVALIAILIGLL